MANGEKSREFREFLLDSFDLRSFVILLTDEGYGDLVYELNVNAAPSEFFFDAIQTFEQRGLINDRLFAALKRARPFKAVAIDAFRRTWLGEGPAAADPAPLGPPDPAPRTPHHPLLQYPPGPKADFSRMSNHLILTFAGLNPKETDVTRLFNAAAQMRRLAEPENRGMTLLTKGQVGAIGDLGADGFWQSAFEVAFNHSPRMLAALILAQLDDLFDEEALRDKAELLEYLRTFNPKYQPPV